MEEEEECCAGSQGLPGTSHGTEASPAQNVLVKPGSTPESGTYLSQHPGLLQPDSRTHWVHVQGITLLQPLLPPPFLPQVCAGLCRDPQQHHSFSPSCGAPASLHPLLRDWLSAPQLLCPSHRPPGPERVVCDSEKTGWVIPSLPGKQILLWLPGFCSCPMAKAAWLLAGQTCDAGVSPCLIFREGSGGVMG